MHKNRLAYIDYTDKNKKIICTSLKQKNKKKRRKRNTFKNVK